MSDGVPTEEQRRRIEHGVLDRIDARRRLARGIAGGVVAVALLAGGLGLVARGSVVSSGSTAGSGSAADRPLSGSATRTVTCAIGVGSDTGSPTVVAVPPGALPAAAIRACGAAAVEFESGGGTSLRDDPTGTGASGTAGGTGSAGSATPSATPSAAAQDARPDAALCVAVDGGLIVIARTGTPEQACTRAGLRPYPS